jgi:hypothetical protein
MIDHTTHTNLCKVQCNIQCNIHIGAVRRGRPPAPSAGLTWVGHAHPVGTTAPGTARSRLSCGPTHVRFRPFRS